MKLFRYDYENQSGKIQEVKRYEIYGWIPVNVKTGEVDCGSFRHFDDRLFKLDNEWQWKRFILTLPK